MNRKTRAPAVVCLLVLALAAPWPCMANGKGKQKGGKHHKDYDHGVDYRGGGPPPWAPAHGYRNKREHDDRGEVVVVTPSAPTAYVAPFGINVGRCNRQELGAVVGGALGGIAGSTVGKGSGRTAAIIGGTVVGILVGGAIGKAMDDIDQNCVGQILEHAPTGGHVRWQDPDGRANYDVIPRDTWKSTDGRYCREYQTVATVAGKKQQVYGTACRQPDGSWEVVK